MDIKGVAVKIAREAGLLLKENLGKAGKVEFKGAVNIVTEADRKSEALIIEEIQSNFPDHGILSEESAEIKAASGYKWIIDPLDGTTNYAHGFPFFCVSIGFEASGKVVLGVIYDPVLDELFVAEDGKGAALNGNPIHVSKTGSLDRSLLATGFPYDLRTSKENNLDHFSNFTLRAQAIRRAGSAALDLCYVASGRFDGYWEMRLRPWDVAAASVIVKEAGGTITDFKGSPFSIYGHECLASNGLIHDEMLGVLRKKTPAAKKVKKP
ncbi:MAG: inositol monophosphatase family protein [Deltaproteobacteria bacterium]|nr:inositol monophosphatase family protein [Deltaproteobacteria bacterium]